MSLLDEEEVLNAWDSTEFVYKKFIDDHMGGNLIYDRGLDYSMFDYNKYSVHRPFKLFLYGSSIEETVKCFVTPTLYKNGDTYMLCAMRGEWSGESGDARFGVEPRYYQRERLCIKDFHEEELKYFGKPIIIKGTNIDNEIVLLDCNPNLQVPGFKIKRLFS